jgi:hypothetical protein
VNRIGWDRRRCGRRPGEQCFTGSSNESAMLADTVHYCAAILLAIVVVLVVILVVLL